MRRRPELRCLAVIVVVCAVLVALDGRAAPADRPLTGAGSPREVLARLQTAVAERDPQVWADCLADTFRFVPTLAVLSAYPDVPWAAWSNARERAFADWLCSPARSAEVRLLDGVLERGLESGGHSTWEVVYTIATGGTVCCARATLDFVELRQSWYLERWEDTRPEPLEGNRRCTGGDVRAAAVR